MTDESEKETHPSGTGTPDARCAVCLGEIEDRSFPKGCSHAFCFTCLVEWSKVRAVCPLCKRPFTHIIHNIRSNDDYDQQVVEQNTEEAPELARILVPLPSRYANKIFRFHFFHIRRDGIGKKRRNRDDREEEKLKQHIYRSNSVRNVRRKK